MIEIGFKFSNSAISREFYEQFQSRGFLKRRSISGHAFLRQITENCFWHPGIMCSRDQNRSRITVFSTVLYFDKEIESLVATWTDVDSFVRLNPATAGRSLYTLYPQRNYFEWEIMQKHTYEEIKELVRNKVDEFIDVVTPWVTGLTDRRNLISELLTYKNDPGTHRYFVIPAAYLLLNERVLAREYYLNLLNAIETKGPDALTSERENNWHIKFREKLKFLLD